MCKDTKDKSDKDCTDKVNQLEKKNNMYIEIRHESFNINNINKNAQV